MTSTAPLPKTLTVFAPDGTQGTIPSENVQAAIDAGGKVGVHIFAPDGTEGFVPHDQLPAAIKAGATFNPKQEPNANPGDVQGSGILNSGMRFLSGAGSALAGAAKGLYGAVTDDSGSTGDKAIQSLAPGGQLGYKLLVKPQIDTYNQGAQMLDAARNSGDLVQGVRGLGHVIASAIPGLGPMIAGTSDAMLPQIDKGNYSGAAGTAATNAALAYLIGKAGAKLMPEATVPGQNFTPSQLAAHTGILGRMNGLGDNFIPQDSAATTGSVIRQAAADNPAIAQTATVKGSTPNNIAALQAIFQKANTALEVPHAATIAQHASVPADVTGVQAAVGQSFPQSLAGVSPEDATAIQQLQQRLGTVNTLGGLNDLRQWLNDEAAAGYKQDGVAAARGTATKAGIRTAADAARNAYYDQLQQASGVDFRPLKAQQSALLDQQEGAAKLGQTLSAQQAIADEPKSPQEVFGNALTGGRALKAGPLAGTTQLITEKLLGRTPLTQPNYLIRKFLSDLPDPTPQAPPVGAPQPTNAPQLPANASPQMVQGQPIPPQPPPSSAPQLVAPLQPQLPAPVQPQLPVGELQRLLANSGQLELPSTTDGMTVSQSPSTPYPALNEATARTRITPTEFAKPEIIPPTTRPVTPSGQVQTPLQRFLNAGELDTSLVNPSTDDLKRAIAAMRKRKGQ
jgi:hypothetical protein